MEDDEDDDEDDEDDDELEDDEDEEDNCLISAVLRPVDGEIDRFCVLEALFGFAGDNDDNDDNDSAKFNESGLVLDV